jgi:hypothetical protein
MARFALPFRTEGNRASSCFPFWLSNNITQENSTVWLFPVMSNLIRPVFWPHRLFAAGHVASIDTPANLINPNSQTTDTAFINVPLLHVLFRNPFYRLLFNYVFPQLSASL